MHAVQCILCQYTSWYVFAGAAVHNQCVVYCVNKQYTQYSCWCKVGDDAPYCCVTCSRASTYCACSTSRPSGSTTRTMMLVVFKSAPILKRALRVKHAMMQLYILKLLKVSTHSFTQLCILKLLKVSTLSLTYSNYSRLVCSHGTRSKCPRSECPHQNIPRITQNPMPNTYHNLKAWPQP